MEQPPLGVRLNNPTNLTYWPQIKWDGLADPPFEGRFCRFTTPQYGFRAAYKQLALDESRGARTVPSLIRTWSPPTENPTVEYTAHVCEWTGFSMTQDIDLGRDGLALLRAIARQENGGDFFADSVIQEGINMATGSKTMQVTQHVGNLTGPTIAAGYATTLIVNWFHDFQHFDLSTGSQVAIMGLATIACTAVAKFFPKAD